MSRVPGPARSARAVILADVEFTNSAGACVQLNRTCDECPVVHWESARPTRSTDRRCSLKTTCNSTQYQTAAGSAFEDRVCAAVSNCTALGHCKANRGRSPVHPHPQPTRSRWPYSTASVIFKRAPPTAARRQPPLAHHTVGSLARASLRSPSLPRV